MINLGVIDIGVPEAIMLFFITFNVVYAIFHYGETVQDTFDMWNVLYTPLSTLILLHWGGFFS